MTKKCQCAIIHLKFALLSFYFQAQQPIINLRIWFLSKHFQIRWPILMNSFSHFQFKSLHSILRPGANKAYGVISCFQFRLCKTAPAPAQTHSFLVCKLVLNNNVMFIKSARTTNHSLRKDFAKMICLRSETKKKPQVPPSHPACLYNIFRF